MLLLLGLITAVLVMPQTSSAYLLSSRWSATQTDGAGLGQGDPATVLWSIVPDGEASWQNTGSNLISYYDDQFNVAQADRTFDLTNRPWWIVMNRNMEKFSRTSGISLVYVAETDANGTDTGMEGDIRVAGKSNMVGGNLGVASGPPTGGLNMRTNPEYVVKATTIHGVFTHEIGHNVGIGHEAVARNTGFNISVMDASGPTSGPNIGVQIDDIYGMQRHYGDVLEKNGGNDTFATSHDIGSFALGESFAMGLDMPDVLAHINEFADDFVGIDGTSDVDFFSFSLTDDLLVNIRLSPQGPEYTSRVHDYLELSKKSDLNLTLYDASENLIVRIDSGGIGSDESLSRVLSAGDYFLRVDGDQDANQMYSLTLSTTLVPEPASLLGLLSLAAIASTRVPSRNLRAHPSRAVAFDNPRCRRSCL